MGEEGKELELGSLTILGSLDSHTMEISGFTRREGGQGVGGARGGGGYRGKWGGDSTPSCAACSWFEWTKGSLPRLIAYLPGCPNVTRCFHKPHPQNSTCF